MILFRANGFELDLTLFGLSLNDESNFFVDNLLKSYSFPFQISLLDDFVRNIGFPNLENNDDPSASVTGILLIDEDYFPATLRFGEIRGEEIEATLYYGEEDLPIYSTKMSQLPWPINLVTSLQALFNKHVDAGWPAVTHNFPMIYRPGIRETTNYENFQYFVNLTTSTNFVQNTITGSDPDFVYNNFNVLSPCPYLLELLRFGFASSGRKVKGEVFQDERLKRLFYIPEKYIEKFKGSTYDDWQFSVPDRTVTIDNVLMGVYERFITPAASGTYLYKLSLNLDPVIAKYFKLRVFRKDGTTSEETIYYFAESRLNRVSIEHDLEVNIKDASEFDPVWVELTLPYRSTSIKPYNSFEMSFKEGKLNELIGTSYTLSDFVPDMTFGEFVNAIKNWLNLDIQIDEENAYINFQDNILADLPEADHTHLQELYPRIVRNGNRLFKLSYSNGDEVMVDSTGQVYSDIDRQDQDVITIKMETQIAKVTSNENFVTAVYPEEGGLCFGIYDGLVGTRNLTIDRYEEFTGKVESVYQAFWKNWLFRRTTNVTITDKFLANKFEMLSLRSRIFKYNRILLPKVIRKRRRQENYWEVEMEAESI